jgi:hypothetical protein
VSRLFKTLRTAAFVVCVLEAAVVGNLTEVVVPAADVETLRTDATDEEGNEIWKRHTVGVV